MKGYFKHESVQEWGILPNLLLPFPIVAGLHRQQLLPLNVILSIICKEEICHVIFTFVEQQQIDGLDKEDQHEDQAGVVHDIQPEHSGLAQMTLVVKVLPDDGECG